MATARTALNSLVPARVAGWWPLAVQRAEPLVALVIAALVATAIQASTDNIIGVDGYYHIKVADLIRERGPRLDFIWLTYTILGPGHYTDHHFLFHVFQAPFTVLDLRLAAKLSAAVFAAASFWAFYRLLVSQQVRWPLLWTGVLLASAYTFLWRQAMARPQCLFLILCYVTFWLMFEERNRWLPLTGFVAAWLFDGFPLFAALPASMLVSSWLLERSFLWKPVVFIGLGMLAGLVIHPYFPRNIEFSVLHLAPKLQLSTPQDVPVGLEWYPYDLRGYITRAGISTLFVVLGLIPPAWRLGRRGRVEPRVLCLFMVAAAFMALTIRSQRLIEYFPAFAALFLAVSWGRSPLRISIPRPARLGALLPRLRLPTLLLTTLVVTYGVYWATTHAQDLARRGVPPSRIGIYRAASQWLIANTPPRSLVFNTDWDDFPQLFFYNDHNTYIFGLDPTYLSIYDYGLYRAWRAISTGQVSQPGQEIRERFGAEWVVTDLSHARFIEQATADPGMDQVFRGGEAIVFHIRDGG
ncbi:MAG: hypothetical protein IT307_18675 [Chloroflexi bacterium]|nr:hypothetical protein [Chloroflexota bacterium]